MLIAVSAILLYLHCRSVFPLFGADKDDVLSRREGDSSSFAHGPESGLSVDGAEKTTSSGEIYGVARDPEVTPTTNHPAAYNNYAQNWKKRNSYSSLVRDRVSEVESSSSAVGVGNPFTTVDGTSSSGTGPAEIPKTVYWCGWNYWGFVASVFPESERVPFKPGLVRFRKSDLLVVGGSCPGINKFPGLVIYVDGENGVIEIPKRRNILYVGINYRMEKEGSNVNEGGGSSSSAVVTGNPVGNSNNPNARALTVRDLRSNSRAVQKPTVPRSSNSLGSLGSLQTLNSRLLQSSIYQQRRKRRPRYMLLGWTENTYLPPKRKFQLYHMAHVLLYFSQQRRNHAGSVNKLVRNPSNYQPQTMETGINQRDFIAYVATHAIGFRQTASTILL